MMKGLLWLAVILGAVTLILSFVFSIPLMTALAVLLIIVFAPVAGILIAMFLPLPGFIKAIIGLVVPIILIVFGLGFLGVV